MTSAVTLATWGLIFGGYFAFAFGLAVLLGRIIGRSEKLAADSERYELDGSWDSFVAERSERRHRAEQRHIARLNEKRERGVA